VGSNCDTVLPACAFIGLGINALIFNLNNSGMSLGQLISPFLLPTIGIISIIGIPIFLPLIGGWIIIVVYCIALFAVIIPTMLSPHNLNLMFGDPIWMLYAVPVLLPLAGGILFIIIGIWKRYTVYHDYQANNLDEVNNSQIADEPEASE